MTTPRTPRDIPLWGYLNDPRQHFSLKQKFMHAPVLWMRAAGRAGNSNTYVLASALAAIHRLIGPTNSGTIPLEASIEELCLFDLRPPMVRHGLRQLERAGLIRSEKRPGKPTWYYILADKSDIERLAQEFLAERKAEKGGRRDQGSRGAKEQIEALLHEGGFEPIPDAPGHWQRNEQAVWVKECEPGIRVSLTHGVFTEISSRAQRCRHINVTRRKIGEEQPESGARIACVTTRAAISELSTFLKREVNHTRTTAA